MGCRTLPQRGCRFSWQQPAAQVCCSMLQDACTITVCWFFDTQHPLLSEALDSMRRGMISGTWSSHLSVESLAPYLKTLERRSVASWPCCRPAKGPFGLASAQVRSEGRDLGLFADVLLEPRVVINCTAAQRERPSRFASGRQRALPELRLARLLIGMAPVKRWKQAGCSQAYRGLPPAPPAAADTAASLFRLQSLDMLSCEASGFF